MRLKDGTTFEHEVQDFPGMPSRPFTWDEVVGKFDQLVVGRVANGLANEVKDAVFWLENIQVADLMQMLNHIRVD